MKNLFTVLFVTIITIGAFSQTKNETDELQTAFGGQKDQLIEHIIILNDEDSKTFHKIYEEYEVKRKELGLVRIDIFKQFTENFSSLNDKESSSIVNQIFDLDKKSTTLLETYYNKVKDAINPKVAAQFYQIETFSLTSIRAAIYQTVPFIGAEE